MDCCNVSFIGVFCTEDNTSVFGFYFIKNGVMTTKYYNTSDNSPYFGVVLTNCTTPSEWVVRVYNENDAHIGIDVFNDPMFALIPTDITSNKRVVFVERDLKDQVEDTTLTLVNSFRVIGSDIRLATPLTNGEILVVKFLKL